MTTTTILFETITPAQKAYDTLQPMIDVSIDCNAVIHNKTDEELVKWLISDRYYQAGAKKKIYSYPVGIISKFDKTTIYQYQDLQIKQKFIPPADWEFVARDSQGKIIDKTWWGYEDRFD